MPYRVERIRFYVRKTLEGLVVVGICVMTGMKKSVEDVSHVIITVLTEFMKLFRVNRTH